MNRIIISLSAVLLLFTSCDPFASSKNKRLTNKHHIINPTGKRMIHELPFIVPLEDKDSLLHYYSNGENSQAELEWTLSYIVGAIRHSQSVLGYKDPINLYNIDDTTCLYWTKYWIQYDDSLKKFCPFYWIPESSECDDNECNRITNYYLMVSDSLLSLMQKDYTMLEKFSEYYGK